MGIKRYDVREKIENMTLLIWSPKDVHITIAVTVDT